MNLPELDYDAIVQDVPDADDLRWLLSLGAGESHSPSYSGTKALMLAVLEDGIRAYLSSAPIVRAEAEQWVESPQRRWAFSFNVICETLGLEPSAVRGALRLLRVKNCAPKALQRSRPNAGHRRAPRPKALASSPKKSHPSST